VRLISFEYYTCLQRVERVDHLSLT